MVWKRDTKVGLFALVGLLATGIVIFIIGNERKVFDAKVTFKTSFQDVQGLKAGAPIRLSGIDIGNVTSVAHAPNPVDDRLYVTLSVVKGEVERVREDSVAKIANKGLLGDKMLELTPGTPGRPLLSPNSTVHSEEPADASNLIAQAGEMAKKADHILANVEKTTATFADDRVRSNLEQSLQSVTMILDSVAAGRGYIGRLISDPNEAAHISQVIEHIEQSTGKLTDTLDHVQRVVARVNEGPGLMHDVLYSEEGAGVLTRLGGLVSELDVMLKGVRDNKSIAHGILYGDPEQEKIMTNLTAMSVDLRDVMAGVKAGKGTVGALLVDPSLYEDVKSLVGNVQRNDVLRALVRYSIKQDEKKPAVQVGEGEKKLPASWDAVRRLVPDDVVLPRASVEGACVVK